MQNETFDLDDEMVEITNDFRSTRKGTRDDVKYTNVLRKIGGYYESIMKKESQASLGVEKEGSVDAEFKPELKIE